VAFHQGHAVNAGLGGQRDDGEGAVGGDGLACQEALSSLGAQSARTSRRPQD
jgi:hypothetical protein